MITMVLTALTSFAHAGVVELGASANYRASNYDGNNYLRSTSYTASLAYYFWEMCALEANYTDGYSQQKSKGPSITDALVKMQDLSRFYAVDLVFSFAEREDWFRPYLKIGGGYLSKVRYRRIDTQETEKISSQHGWVPSAGLGLAIGLGRLLSLKVGGDAWTTPREAGEPVTVDYAARAGVSCLF